MTDSQLYISAIQSFILGDNESLGVFFEKNKGPLVFYAYSFVKNKEVASDLVLDVFHKLLSMDTEQRKERLTKDEAHFKNLLYVILRNKALDYIKVEKNRKEIVEKAFEIPLLADLNNAEEIFVNDSFSSLLNELGEQQSKVIRLHLDGYKLEEIADELNIAYNTARNTLASARKRVKELWEIFFN